MTDRDLLAEIGRLRARVKELEAQSQPHAIQSAPEKLAFFAWWPHFSTWLTSRKCSMTGRIDPIGVMISWSDRHLVGQPTYWMHLASPPTKAKPNDT